MISRMVFLLSMILMIFLVFGKNTLTVKAVSEQDLVDAEKVMRTYDGISNWSKKSNNPSNQIGKIPIGTTKNGTAVSLDYTFGSARNSIGTVTAGDKTITKTSSRGTVRNAPTINNSKINIFLNYGGKYYGILHQGDNSYIGGSGTPEKASDTSIDFALLTGGSQGSNFYDGMNLLTNLDPIAGTNGANDKLFYTGTDANGKPVYKLVGYYSKNRVFVEIVLRPSLSGSPIVQRELYVYNAGSSTSFQTFYGEDTGLNPNNDSTSDVDNVPMYAIGGGQGLYLMSGSTYTPASKLFVTNNVDGGFKDFMGRVLTNPTDWSVKGKQSSSSSDIVTPKLPFANKPTSDQDGDTAIGADINLMVGTTNSGSKYNIVNNQGKQDTAYILRWPETTDLATGGVVHFASNIGATVSGLSVPSVKKTYTNLTSNSGTNHVGDTLQFKLTARNDGYNSSWTISRILDAMPAGLTIVPGSISSSYVQGNNVDFNPQIAISDKGSQTYSFKAVINNQAPYNLTNGHLTNKVNFTGHNSDQNDNKTYSDSVTIPVATPNFKYRFTKLVKNYTNDPDGAFFSKATGKKDDIMEYQVHFTSNGTDTLNSGNFYDSLPAGLELVPGSVTLNGSSKDSLSFPVGTFANNITNTIDFKAKVTGTEATTASNTAYLQNVKTSGGETYSSIQTEANADVDIQKTQLTTAIVKVPTMIDFGSMNSDGSERILPNVKTDGQLVVDHTEDTPFQVTVSYDNNGENPIHSGDTKLIQDNKDALFFNQDDNDSLDEWTPISASGIPIKQDGFTGSHTNYDLTKYIGLNKWKLRVPSQTQAGNYTGQVTWGIADSIQ